MTVVALVVAAIQTGLIAAVSALAAPTAFQALAADAAGRYLRRLFPRYFAAAAALALVAAPAALAGGDPVAGIVLMADGACFIFALALIPGINAARGRGDGRFRRLHAYTVVANGVGLLLALVALLRIATT